MRISLEADEYERNATRQPLLVVIPSKLLLRSEGSERAARSVAFSDTRTARLARLLIDLPDYFPIAFNRALRRDL